MSADEIIGKLKRISAILIFVTLCAACPVRADQQFVLTVGDTMVIPCLLELWSDQSVSCVISNPEVLMSDGSGRAVIALSEGVSDVYVHLTNPDTDVRYTFVVESAQPWEAPGEWAMPEETTVGGAGADGGARADGGTGSDGSVRAVGGAGNGGSVRADGGAGADGGARVSDEAEVSDDTRVNERTPGSDAAEGNDVTPGSDTADSGREDLSGDEARQGGTIVTESRPIAGGEADTQSGESSGGRADLHEETHMPEEDGQSDRGTARKVPFWEDRGSGGISFEVIEDDFPGRAEGKEDAVGHQGAKYRPFAYLKGDGEVVPLFVCAAGREVRWKYIGRILYIEASGAYTGPYRVSACDSRGNICYFSS